MEGNVHVNAQSTGPELYAAARQLRHKAARLHGQGNHKASVKNAALADQMESAGSYKLSHSTFRVHICNDLSKANGKYQVRQQLYRGKIVAVERSTDAVVVSEGEKCIGEPVSATPISEERQYHIGKPLVLQGFARVVPVAVDPTGSVMFHRPFVPSAVPFAAAPAPAPHPTAQIVPSAKARGPRQIIKPKASVTRVPFSPQKELSDKGSTTTIVQLRNQLSAEQAKNSQLQQVIAQECRMSTTLAHELEQARREIRKLHELHSTLAARLEDGDRVVELQALVERKTCLLEEATLKDGAMIKRMDVDGDGRVSGSEVEQHVQQLTHELQKSSDSRETQLRVQTLRAREEHLMCSKLAHELEQAQREKSAVHKLELQKVSGSAKKIVQSKNQLSKDLNTRQEHRTALTVDQDNMNQLFAELEKVQDKLNRTKASKTQLKERVSTAAGLAEERTVELELVQDKLNRTKASKTQLKERVSTAAELAEEELQQQRDMVQSTLWTTPIQQASRTPWFKAQDIKPTLGGSKDRAWFQGNTSHVSMHLWRPGLLCDGEQACTRALHILHDQERHADVKTLHDAQQKVMNAYESVFTSQAVIRLSEVRAFERSVAQAGTSTEIVAAMVQQHRKVRKETEAISSQEQHTLLNELRKAQQEISELKDKVSEFEALMGCKRCEAMELVRRLTRRMLLRTRMKLLSSHVNVKKRIVQMRTRDCVVQEMLTVAKQYVLNLDMMSNGYLVPLREALVLKQVGTTHDPNGWTLHEFDIFLASLDGLRVAHLQAIPELEKALQGEGSRVVSVCEFYGYVMKRVLDPLVQYMNRLTFMMHYFKEHRNFMTTVGDGRTMTIKELLVDLQKDMPGNAKKLPLDFFLFGVLQAATSWQGLLERLVQLTPDTHVSIDSLRETTEAMKAMNFRIDRRCGKFKELEKVQISLLKPVEYLCCESRRWRHTGDLHTFGRVQNSEDSDFTISHKEICQYLGGDNKEPCRLILLSDMALLCEPNQVTVDNPKWRPGGRNPKQMIVTKYSVRRVLHKPEAGALVSVTSTVFAFMSQKQGLFMFEAADELKKTEWIEKIVLRWGAKVVTEIDKRFNAY